MSDNSSWASPGWQPDTAGATVESTSPGGYASVSAPPAAGWTPPPRPGLIPLRPLDFGALFGATFLVLRRNPRPTFGAALLINALVMITSFGLMLGVVFWGVDRTTRASIESASAIEAGMIGLVIVAGLVAVGLSIVAQALLQGVIVLEVARATLGEKLTLRQLLAAGRGRWGALIGWTGILTGALVVVLGVFITVITVLIAVGGPAGAAIGILLAIGGGLAMAVGTIWLSVKLSVVPCAIMLDRLPLSAAVRRGWALVGGSFWRVLGILLLVTVIVQTASSIVTTPFSLLSGLAPVLVNPASDPATMIGVLVLSNVLVIAVSVVVGAIGSVLVSAATALLYLDLRMRKEGLDLELQRFVELRAAGQPAVDPYEATARS